MNKPRAKLHLIKKAGGDEKQVQVLLNALQMVRTGKSTSATVSITFPDGEYYHESVGDLWDIFFGLEALSEKVSEEFEK